MLRIQRFLVGASLFVGAISVAQAAPTLSAEMHKNPWCGCCSAYADYLGQHGISVKRIDYDDLEPVKKRLGTNKAASCHTLEIGGYAVEGHVPVAAIHRLLQEQPAIKAIALPGMPGNSPGMGPEIKGSLNVLKINDTGDVLGSFGKF